MVRRHLVIGGLVVASGAFVWFRLHTRPEHRTSDLRETPGLVSGNAATSSGTSEEVARLRAELREKDLRLKSLRSVALSAQARSAEAVQSANTWQQAVESEPPTRAVDVLDERLFMAPKDARRASQMEEAIRMAAQAADLSPAKLISAYCGSDICKITLSAESETEVNQSMERLSTHLPKQFGASAVHELGDGTSALYVAESSEALAIEPVEQNPGAGEL